LPTPMQSRFATERNENNGMNDATLPKGGRDWGFSTAGRTKQEGEKGHPGARAKSCARGRVTQLPGMAGIEEVETLFPRGPKKEGRKTRTAPKEGN